MLLARQQYNNLILQPALSLAIMLVFY